MASPDSKPLHSRLEAVGISQNTFAAYAKVHDADVSRVVRGLHVAPGPIERITKAITALEDLVAADPLVKIDMRDVANIKAAQKRLAEKRANPAQAPWQFRGTEVSHADAPQTNSARAALAGASESNS
jgi:hypothetical protein